MQIQLVGQRVGLVGKPCELQPFPGLGSCCRMVQRSTAEHGHQRHVLQHSEMREGPRNLISTRDACLGDAVRRQARKLSAFKQHLPARSREMPAHHVDECRLARTIRPEQPEDLPLVDLQAHAAQRLHATKGLGQVHDFKQDLGAGRCSRLCRCSDSFRFERHKHRRHSLLRAKALHEEPQNPVRHEQDHQHQDHAHSRLAQYRVVAGGEEKHEAGDRHRTHRRTGPMPRSAEHAHQHHRQRHRDVEGFTGRHIRHEQRVDAAGEARQCA